MRIIAIAAMLLATTPVVAAEEDAATRTQRWQDLKHAVWGDRVVTEASGLIALDAPIRAQDAALVPVTISLPTPGTGADKIKSVFLVVDGNPSPVAGTFIFGPDADPRTLKTRVRVDQYTLIHAVAETEDGRLLSAERYVKAAGGCSAPSSKDPVLAMSRLGQMRLRLDGDQSLHDGVATTANLLISHPNNNGMQVDQLSHNFIPPRYIQDISIKYGNTLVLRVEADISLSEDPVITFGFVPHGEGPMHVDMQDSTQAVFHASFPATGPT